MTLFGKMGSKLVNGSGPKGGVTPEYVPCSRTRSCGCEYSTIGHCYDNWCCDTHTGEMCGDTGCTSSSGCPACWVY